MKLYIVVITCDINDGDYIKSHFVVPEDILEQIRKSYNTVQRLKQSYYDNIAKNNKHYYTCYKDNLPYYNDVMCPILMIHRWDYSETNVKYLEWVKSLSEEDIEDALYLYDILPYLDNEEVHTIVSIEAYETVGEKIDLV